jgi:hypothetical protein
MSRRRWLGGVVLALAIIMLVCGETVLKGRLSGMTLLAYWLACLVLTSIAMVVALRDLRAQRQHARKQEKELLESTIKEIQLKAREKAQRPGTHGNNGKPSA